MRFEVLGPVTVRTEDGSPVAVPGAKVRALLADLLVHHGRPVPVDRLVDDLWGDTPPGNPANTLQTKVSLLRRVLDRAEEGARALVAYGPAGYALRVPDEAVDSGRFAALTARARRESDPRARASLLADALRLWRGGAFADVRDAPFARAAIARLEEQRLTALEELAELRLETGEHVLPADELGDAVADHPLRERLRAAHMLALYRAGRQNEALDAYADIRRRLAEELGVDPGARLTALHQAILRQDPDLAPAAPAAATSPVTAVGPAGTDAPVGTGAPDAAGVRPRTNLPAPVSSLVGRREAVARVCALVAAGRLVTLTGPGGVGKTRLALEAAARLADAEAEADACADVDAGGGVCPDGVWFVELAGAAAARARTWTRAGASVPTASGSSSSREPPRRRTRPRRPWRTRSRPSSAYATTPPRRGSVPPPRPVRPVRPTRFWNGSPGRSPRAASSSSSTTASTSSSRSPRSSDGCCAGPPGCASWPPAGSPWRSPARSSRPSRR